MQNEDGNTNVVFISPDTLAKSAPIPIAAVNGSGGFDDILFTGGKTYLTASNPSNNPNTDPAIVSAMLSGSTMSTTPILAGNVTATVLNSGSAATQLLNLQDPDSLSITADGRVVMTSQGDGQLIFVNGIGTATQSVGVLNLTTFVDDTAFGGNSTDTLLVADKQTNTIYAITGAFNPNNGYSAAADTNGQNGFIGLLNTSAFGDGSLAPIVTGLGNPGGEAFLPAVPEPSTWAMMILGFFGLGFIVRRQKHLASAAAF
jgi:predicted regulator of Ras-like GTPase activity (Roadblock/LC7/MglB family)